MAAPATITPSEVDEFLSHTSFEGYHSVPLPFGRRVPGRDASRTADTVLGDRVRGKTLLDIGTFYGFYPSEAILRGARFAVGIEPDAQRCAVAKRIAALNGDRWEIAEAWAEDYEPKQRFDFVLALRVLHWARDPVAFLRRIAAWCDESVIVEFRRPSHAEHLRRELATGGPVGRLLRALGPLGLGVVQALLDAIGHSLPLASIGSHGWFFTPKGFERLFVTQTRIFDRVEFSASSTRSCTIALCRPAAKGA
jgi:hypothetical protein